MGFGFDPRRRQLDRMISEAQEQAREEVTGRNITRNETNPLAKGLRVLGSVLTGGRIAPFSNTFSQDLEQVDPRGRAFAPADEIGMFGKATAREDIPALGPDALERLEGIPRSQRNLLKSSTPEAIADMDEALRQRMFPEGQTFSLPRGGLGEVDPFGKVNILQPSTLTDEEQLIHDQGLLARGKEAGGVLPSDPDNPRIRSYVDSGLSAQKVQELLDTEPGTPGAIDDETRNELEMTIQSRGVAEFKKMQDSVFTRMLQNALDKPSAAKTMLEHMLRDPTLDDAGRTLTRDALAQHFVDEAGTTHVGQLRTGVREITNLAKEETNAAAAEDLWQKANDLELAANLSEARTKGEIASYRNLDPKSVVKMFERRAEKQSRIFRGMKVLESTHGLSNLATGTPGNFINFGRNVLNIMGLDGDSIQQRLQGVSAEDLASMTMDRKQFVIAAMEDILGEPAGRLSNEDRIRLEQLQGIAGVTILPDQMFEIYLTLTNIAIRENESLSQQFLSPDGPKSSPFYAEDSREGRKKLGRALRDLKYPTHRIKDMVEEMVEWQENYINPNLRLLDAPGSGVSRQSNGSTRKSVEQIRRASGGQ